MGHTIPGIDSTSHPPSGWPLAVLGVFGLFHAASVLPGILPADMRLMPWSWLTLGGPVDIEELLSLTGEMVCPMGWIQQPTGSAFSFGHRKSPLLSTLHTL